MYDPDPYEDYEVDGIKYRLRKSQIAKVEYMAEKKLEEWILDQEYKMDKQEYLEFLIK